MKKSNSKTNSPKSGKADKDQTPNTKKCEEIPSLKACLACDGTKPCNLCNATGEDAELNSKELLARFANNMDDLTRAPITSIPIFLALVRKELEAENKCLDKIIAEKKCTIDLLSMDEHKPPENRIKIPIAGKKSDFGQRLGFFFFGKDNANGLKLPQYYLESLLDIICENFSPLDGTTFSHRSLKDNADIGKKMHDYFSQN